MQSVSKRTLFQQKRLQFITANFKTHLPEFWPNGFHAFVYSFTYGNKKSHKGNFVLTLYWRYSKNNILVFQDKYLTVAFLMHILSWGWHPPPPPRKHCCWWMQTLDVPQALICVGRELRQQSSRPHHSSGLGKAMPPFALRSRVSLSVT